MIRLRRQLHDDAGAAVVELALVVPILCGIVMGLVTTAIAVFAQLQVSTAAEEGARAMYVGGTATQAAAATVAAAWGTPAVAGSAGSLPGSWTCTSPGNSGKTVTVTLTRPDMTIQFLAFTTSVSVNGRAVTRCA